MNASTIANRTSTPYDSTSSGIFKQRSQDFKALSAALQSGNLADAQKAYAAFQKDVQNGTQNSTGNSTSAQPAKVTSDLQALSDALKSGDVTSAQKAFATLKKDLVALRGAHGHHGHHHKAANDGDASAASGSTTAASSSNASAGALPNALA